MQMSAVGEERRNKMKKGKVACKKWRKMMWAGKNQRKRKKTRDGKGTIPPVAKQVQNAP